MKLATNIHVFRQSGQYRSLAGLPSCDLQEGILLRDISTGNEDPDHLCLTISRDVREDVEVEIRIGDELRLHARADYTSAGQRLRIALDPSHALAIRSAGTLQLRSTARLWVVAPNDIFPRLGISLCSENEPPDFLQRIKDSAITQFGWMHGCVLDALDDLYRNTGDKSFLEALELQLGRFLTPEAVDYEAPDGSIARNTFHSIELTLPFAVIARRYPGHPSIGPSLAFLRSRQDAGGLITDGYSTTAEGCYTIAYPLMVLAAHKKDREIRKMALDQLRLRREALWLDDSVFLRNFDGCRSYRNWARGVCWYFLGHVRTLMAAQEEPDQSLLAHLLELADCVAGWQDKDGLWRNFFDDSSEKFDTSGSAGIACALALAANRGWIPASHLERARACHAALGGYLVDGGFLEGVAPNNKRGEAEQRSNRRTCEPFALGLFGQLHAALLPGS